jgi:putative ribosome biogenesis GTPase RsgA
MSEPACALAAAVDNGVIEATRIESYRELLTQIENKARRRD